jgi:hypothetical protein
MTATISRLYDNYADAQKAVQGLEAAGVPHADISIVANNSDNWYGGNKVDRDHDGVDDRAEGAGKGAGIGAGLGGAAGLLAGLGLLAIPGLGPVVAAGWLAATAVGAAAGAATGGIVGAHRSGSFQGRCAALRRRRPSWRNVGFGPGPGCRSDPARRHPEPVRRQSAGSQRGLAKDRLANVRPRQQALRC